MNLSDKDLYNRLSYINEAIIIKYNKDESINFFEHFIFQASSFYLSILRNKIFNLSKSIVKGFVYRSIIETLSILKMYKEGKISSDSDELISLYSYIKEKQIYERYKETLINNKLIIYDQIINNFKSAKDKYEKIYNKHKTEDIKRKMKSKLPFLLESYNYDGLIREYYPVLYESYKLLSICIHPNDLNVSSVYFDAIDFDNIDIIIKKHLINYIDFYYGAMEECKDYFELEANKVENNIYNKIYLNCVNNQKESLFTISKSIEKEFGKNTTSLLLKEIGLSIKSLAIDKIYGFSEVVKAKFKPLSELFSTFYYVQKLSINVTNRVQSKYFSKHTRYNFLKVLELNTEKEIEDSYLLWKLITNENNKEKFIKDMNKTMGFIIGNTSINDFVYEMIDYIYTDKNNNSNVKLLYDESQLFSHANGYMVSSNEGAFNEILPIIIYVDNITIYFLKKYLLYIKIVNSINNDKKYSELIETIDKQINIFLKEYNKKIEMDNKLKDFMINLYDKHE